MNIKTIKSNIASAKQSILLAETNSLLLEEQQKKRLFINLVRSYADLYENVEPTGDLFLSLGISADDLIGEESVSRLQMAFVGWGKVVTISTI